MTTALLGFALAATLVILAPGPDFMLVMRNTVRGGRRAGWVTGCGTLSGLTVWALAAALGLSALLRVSHVAYDMLRFCGAAYLIWLGVTSLVSFRRKRTGRAGEAGVAADLAALGQAPVRPARAYLNGMLSGPGASITRVEARAKPSSAVVTGPSYARRRRPITTFSARGRS